MTNREKLNIIYERMWWYTNPRKDDKTWWIIYDQNPVLIGNVLEYARINCNDISRIQWVHIDDMYLSIIYMFNKRLPIDEQSDECIDFVYALTKE